MKSLLSLILITVLILTGSSYIACAQDSSDILKEGLLGAGSGLIGGLAAGGKGKDVWKGALAGAGVNVVGGALLDSISGEHVEHQKTVKNMNSQDAYSQAYKEGYSNGFKQGYTQGYKDGVAAK